jgi:hypothetical protein
MRGSIIHSSSPTESGTSMTDTTDSGPLHGLSLPQTAIATSALRYARQLEEPAIFNHSVRTYLYGRFAGERQGIQAGRDYDDELLFLGCLLHDSGLSDEGNGEQSFELDGADLAARFLTDEGLAAERVEIVWDAIALHLHDVALRKRPEIALVRAGAGFDLSGHGLGDLPAEYRERIDLELPRLGGGIALRDVIVEQALARPEKARPFTFPGELVRQQTGQIWPTWDQLVLDSTAPGP